MKHRKKRQISADVAASDEAYANLLTLCDEIGSRFPGSDGERRAADFIEAKLADYGLTNVHREPFDYQAWKRGRASLEMTAPVRRGFSCVALPCSPSAEIEAEIIDAGQGLPADFDGLGEEVKDRIAVVSAGPPGSRFSKYRRAEASGAVAFLFVSDLPGMLVRTGRLPRELDSPDPGALIPGIAVCKEIGDERLILMGRPDLVPLFRQVAGEMELSLPVSSEVWRGGADQVPFSENGVLAAILVDGAARGWAHTEADTVDKVSRKTLRLAAGIATRLLLGVSRAEKRPLTNACE